MPHEAQVTIPVLGRAGGQSRTVDTGTLSRTGISKRLPLNLNKTRVSKVLKFTNNNA